MHSQNLQQIAQRGGNFPAAAAAAQQRSGEGKTNAPANPPSARGQSAASQAQDPAAARYSAQNLSFAAAMAAQAAHAQAAAAAFYQRSSNFHQAQQAAAQPLQNYPKANPRDSSQGAGLQASAAEVHRNATSAHAQPQGANFGAQGNHAGDSQNRASGGFSSATKTVHKGANDSQRGSSNTLSSANHPMLDVQNPTQNKEVKENMENDLPSQSTSSSEASNVSSVLPPPDILAGPNTCVPRQHSKNVVEASASVSCEKTYNSFDTCAGNAQTNASSCTAMEDQVPPPPPPLPPMPTATAVTQPPSSHTVPPTAAATTCQPLSQHVATPDAGPPNGATQSVGQSNGGMPDAAQGQQNGTASSAEQDLPLASTLPAPSCTIRDNTSLQREFDTFSIASKPSDRSTAWSQISVSSTGNTDARPASLLADSGGRALPAPAQQGATLPVGSALPQELQRALINLGETIMAVQRRGSSLDGGEFGLYGDTFYEQ